MEGFRSLYRVRVRNKGCDGWGIRVWLEVFGLFPRARGTRGFIHQPAASLRFIPAGAGNTRRLPLGAVHQSVYPRWRGEHARFAVVFHFRAGLSPLARGTLFGGEPVNDKLRFIPAGAGTTIGCLNMVIPIAVYPRWRGEHAPRSTLTTKHLGLSPLARGTLKQWASANGIRRFIPAGAGNT